MTQTAWDDLPNAKHIDRILADLKKNPDKWNDARSDTRSAVWSAAYSAAMDATYSAAMDAAWNAARDAAYSAAMDAAWNAASLAAWTAARRAILALIAYDDCAYLLDEKPEHVQILGLLGNHAAILLYPACVALQKEMA